MRLGDFTKLDNTTPILLLLSGLSESGKSLFGQTAVNNGWGNRLKVYKTIAIGASDNHLPLAKDGSNNPFSIASELPSSQQGEMLDFIVADFQKKFLETQVPVAVVETFKHPWLVDGLRDRTDIRAISLFIEADFANRLTREASKKKLTAQDDINELAETIRQKDVTKASYGNMEIRRTADILVVNNGDLYTYLSFTSVCTYPKLTRICPKSTSESPNTITSKSSCLRVNFPYNPSKA